MAEIRNENHIVIHGWMRNELGLKGNELLVFALIYGFSQDGESAFRGKLQFVQDWVGISKKTAITILQNLSENVKRKVLVIEDVKKSKGDEQ